MNERFIAVKVHSVVFAMAPKDELYEFSAEWLQDCVHKAKRIRVNRV